MLRCDTACLLIFVLGDPMKSGCRKIAVVAAAAVTASLSQAALAATSDVGPSAGAVAPILGGAAANYFQTLTIEAAGQLSGVTVQVGVNQTPVENLTATIYGTTPGSGSDPFTPDTGNVLGTATVQPGLSSSDPFAMSDVAFSFAPIAVSVGDQLALGLTSSKGTGDTCGNPTGAGAACQYNWGYENTGYAGGLAFNTNPISGAFQPLNVGTADFGFATTAAMPPPDGVIPLPAGLPLMLGAAGALWAVRRRA